ncbi:MAG TPA: PhaM family polyhydroxyalkanoate granule multifunctional regulatory protein [Zeimonas sp.]|nr:PhaM family polyhydroxyalkanoate granule multifunctional regulatory protein [Zeimonas sp.]
MAGKLGIGDLASMGLGKVGIGPLNVGNVLDTVEFVKRAWASFGVPPGFAPTVDVEELDKRIADLKAVEQWLTVNMNMLHGTIQALEIQRGTIATLQAFGAPIAAPATQAIATAIGRATGASKAGMDEAAAAAAVTPAPGPGQTGEAPPAAASGTGRKAGAARETKRAAGAAAAPGFAAPGFADPGLSPGAWWNLLQSQFNQVAAAALSGVGLPKAREAAAETRRSADAPTRAKARGARRTAGVASAGAKQAGAARAAKGRGGTRKA